MRLLSAVLVFWLCMALLPVRASSLDDQNFDQQTIDALQLKIDQSQPREHCFLYAELVHHLAEFSLRRYTAGDVDKSAALLRQVSELSGKIHRSFHQDTRRVKNAEILLRHTAFRLKEMLHASNYEDQEAVAAALAQVTQVQQEAMMQVFAK